MTQTVVGGIQPPRLVSVLLVQKTRLAWQILLLDKDIFKILFYFEERKWPAVSFDHHRSALCWDFLEWLSAVWGYSVWRRNLSSPNYHQLHACMDGKKKTVNGNWYTGTWISWLLCSGRCILHISCAHCSEHITVRNSYVEEGYFFYSLSDLLLPVNSCECVAQDFLSICKSKTFFYFLSFSLLFCLYSLFMKEWEWENGRWKNPLHSWS